MIENCRFEDNHASSSGGGLYANGVSGAVLNCWFSGNEAARNGGGVFSQLSDLSIANSVFVDNSAGQSNLPTTGGGAIFNYLTGRIAVLNCTFFNNRTKFDRNSGGAIHSMYADALIENSVLWGNFAIAGSQVFSNPANRLSIAFSDIDQAEYGLPNSNDNISAPPLWVDPARGDFRLQLGSPCIDRGSGMTGLQATDYDGNPRVAGATVDLGAFEYAD